MDVGHGHEHCVEGLAGAQIQLNLLNVIAGREALDHDFGTTHRLEILGGFLQCLFEITCSGGHGDGLASILPLERSGGIQILQFHAICLRRGQWLHLDGFAGGTIRPTARERGQ